MKFPSVHLAEKRWVQFQRYYGITEVNPFGEEDITKGTLTITLANNN